jgi:hypothetical protein
MLALLVGALGFFIFGYSEPSHLADRSQVEKPRLAFHDFSLDALRGLFSRKEDLREAISLQEDSLLMRFPRAAQRLQALHEHYAARPPLELASALLKEHRSLLQERMGLKHSSAAHASIQKQEPLSLKNQEGSTI